MRLWWLVRLRWAPGEWSVPCSKGRAVSAIAVMEPGAKAPIVIARELALKLKAGPTMVFSDREPESDPEVAKIDENFTKEVKGYKSVFFSVAR